MSVQKFKINFLKNRAELVYIFADSYALLRCKIKQYKISSITCLLTCKIAVNTEKWRKLGQSAGIIYRKSAWLRCDQMNSFLCYQPPGDWEPAVAAFGLPQPLLFSFSDCLAGDPHDAGPGDFAGDPQPPPPLDGLLRSGDDFLGVALPLLLPPPHPELLGGDFLGVEPPQPPPLVPPAGGDALPHPPPPPRAGDFEYEGGDWRRSIRGGERLPHEPPPLLRGGES